MSKCKSEKQNKLKANIEDLLKPLLKQLANCPKNDTIRRICNLVEKNVEERKKLDSECTRLFEEIERQIDQWKEKEQDDNKLIENFNKLLRKYRADLIEILPDKSNPIRRTTEVGESSNNNKQEDDGLRKLEKLDELEKHCCYSLGIFPKNIELKKRLLVYWWIGLELIPSEREGKEIFSHLVNKGILKPVHTKKHNGIIDQCIIDPTIHQNLISTDYHGKQELVINDNVLFNLVHNYLSSQEIKKIFGEKKALKVVQLGRWHCTTEVQVDDKINTKGKKSQDHIEVDDTDFLKKLGEKVTYLSLQNIANLDGLPKVIGKLDNLRIFDLRCCHNLEKLPQLRLIKNKTKWFKNLTHLDLLECHLLDHIPKWICELSNLEVLKGFITGEGGKKKKICQLRDLSKLKKLRKLSIKITKPIDPQDVGGLESLDLLSVLTMTWDIQEHGNENGTVCIILFPKCLEKLDIRCYPKDELKKLLPVVLPCLKRLYIRGGNLIKFGLTNSWKIKILRLRFLKCLESGWPEITNTFTNLEFIEYVECPYLIGFPFREGTWNTKTDGPFPTIDNDYLGKSSSKAPLLFPKDISGRIELEITDKLEAPLDEYEQTVMLKLRGSLCSSTGPGLDLVIALEISPEMEGDDTFENMKSAARYVINELGLTDRLSIVFSTRSSKDMKYFSVREWPLRRMTKDAKQELLHVVNNLTPVEPDENVYDDLDQTIETAKRMLSEGEDRDNNQSQVQAIILLSTPPFSLTVLYYFNGFDVGVHVFEVGVGHHSESKDEIELPPIRDFMYTGGTISHVPDANNLTKAVAVCLAGLLTVVVQDLKLTITTIHEKSKVDLPNGYRVNSREVVRNAKSQHIIYFGVLYSGEVQKVLLQLALPAAVDEDGSSTDVLKVSYTYKLLGQIFESNDVIVNVNRMKTVPAEKRQAPQEIIAEMARINVLDILKNIISEPDIGQYFVDYLTSLETLDDELSTLLRDELIAMSRKTDWASFACSLYVSHCLQRAATRGDIGNSIRSFGTPAMFKFLERVEHMRRI